VPNPPPLQPFDTSYAPELDSLYRLSQYILSNIVNLQLSELKHLLNQQRIEKDKNKKDKKKTKKDKKLRQNMVF
jgi:hypothetical protein